MATITTSFGKGGANIGDGSPNLADTLRDVADDLATVKVATITSASGVAAAGANPTKAEYDVVVTLVNEIKTKLNTIAGGTIKTVKG